MSEQAKPYVNLGSHLRYVREQSRQTLAEVSGAVEIEEKQLQRIEDGLERPAEEILLLLISHFDIKDHEAMQLWELADYEGSLPAELRSDNQSSNAKPTVMLLALDMRTMYSDGLDVTVNPSGVTLQFNQANGPNGNTPVAKIGMSHQQAEMVVKTMQKALLHAKFGNGSNLLPPPQDHQA